MTTSSRIIRKKNYVDVLEKVQYILLDIDGVVWSGDNIIPGVPETLHYLRNVLHKQIRFISNNVLLSRKEIVQEFLKKGISEVTESEVYNASYAAALRLQQLLGKSTHTTEATINGKESNNNKDSNDKQNSESNMPLVHGNVFVIGEQGLCDEIQRVLAPGYITYGTELNDMNAIGVPYTSHLFASAWTQRILPAPSSTKKWCLNKEIEHNKYCNQSNKSMSKHDTTYKVKKDANKVSLSDLKIVAVVAGLDFHFNICKLACASMILQGSSSSYESEIQQQTINHNQQEQMELEKENWQYDNSCKKMLSDTSVSSICSNYRESVTDNSGSNTVSTECMTSRVSKCAPALYIATNPDPCDPAGVHLPLMPASGSIIAALNTCSTRLPHAICGKPELDMAKILFAHEHISNPQETCLMIGDRLTTDIAFGNTAGCKTMLVLSGVDQHKDVNDAIRCNEKHELVPNYIADSLAVFLPSSSSHVCSITDVNCKSKTIDSKVESVPLPIELITTTEHTSKSPITLSAKL